MRTTLLLLLLCSLALPAFAGLPEPPAGLRLDNNGGLNNPEDLLGETGLLDRITDWIFAILLTISVIFVLLAAFKYLTSKGGEGVSDAHKMLIWAAVAIAVGILAKGFVNIVRILVTNE